MKVVAVRKDNIGTITDYKLENGKVIGHSEAVSMVESGKLEGYNVATAKNGVKSIRSNPDGDSSNNLDSLPIF